MHKERKTAKETFVLIKTGFPFPEREFAVEKHFFKTGLTFLSVLTNISFLNIAFGTVNICTYVLYCKKEYHVVYMKTKIACLVIYSKYYYLPPFPQQSYAFLLIYICM